MRRPWGTILAAALINVMGAGAQDLGFSNEANAVRFAVIGDSGTGGNRQKAIADRMVSVRKDFPFEFVLMLGDNIYGSERQRDFQRKFERPYAALLSAGVKFYAVLGNHDEHTQRFYPLFNMGGRRYYSFAPHPDVRIFALDSTRMDAEQIRWLEEELARAQANSKIVFMHHPLYSSGKRHGPSLQLRRLLEPMFIRNGVDAVFAGHEHFYERLKLQQGIQYFISGAAAKLRRSNIRKASETACGFDQDNSFVLVELGRDTLRFAALSRDGTVVDRGEIRFDQRSEAVSATCAAD